MANIELDGANKKIKVDSGDLTLDVPGDIVLDADGGDVVVADGGTNILKVTNSSSDVVLQPQVDAKDIIFKQYDGTTVATVEDNGTFNIPTDKLAINGTAVTSTAAELNIVDGGTSATSTTIVDADRVVLNDNGTMVQVAVTDLKTYIGGGTHVLVGSSASESATSSVNFDNVFSSTYSKYLILAHRLTTSGNNENVYIQVRTGGSNQTSSAYNYILTGNKSNTTGTSNINVGYNSQAQWMVTRGIENTDYQGGGSLSLHVFDPATTSYNTRLHGVTSLRKGTSGDYEAYTFGGQREQTGVVHDGIRIYPSSGNFNQHQIYIYGVKDS